MSRIWIRNARICDGTGAPEWKGDLLIEGDRITRMWRAKAEAVPEQEMEKLQETAQEINAKGLLATPGFVDIHRHCDSKPFYGTEFGDVLLTQGITTTVVGNCGISMTPAPKKESAAREMYDFYEAVLGPISSTQLSGLPRTYPEYRRKLAQTTLPVNMAAMIGTGAVKIAVKGFADTPYTEAEMEQAVRLIQEAMEQGAPGVSLGIMYLPECYSSREEFIRLLQPVGAAKKVITTHIRGEGDSLVESVREVIEIAAKAGCALEISHLKSCGMANWRREIHRAIHLIEEARAAGQDVSCDFYPYEGGSTALTTMLPPAFVKDSCKKAGFIGNGMEAALQRLGTPEGVEAFREAAAQIYPDWDNYAVTLGWDRILISGVTQPEHRAWLGKSVQEIADCYGYSDACAVAADLMYTEQGKTAIINLSMCQEDIDTIARLPYSSLISDAIYADTDTPHPRMYGAFPKFLREYVRERKILTLPEAIRKMTWLPARRMRLEGCGRLAEGYLADVNLFDPEQFRDHATFEHPAQYSTGLSWCILNGEIVVRDGAVCRRDCGKML